MTPTQVVGIPEEDAPAMVPSRVPRIPYYATSADNCTAQSESCTRRDECCPCDGEAVCYMNVCICSGGPVMDLDIPSEPSDDGNGPSDPADDGDEDMSVDDVVTVPEPADNGKRNNGGDTMADMDMVADMGIVDRVEDMDIVDRVEDMGMVDPGKNTMDGVVVKYRSCTNKYQCDVCPRGQRGECRQRSCTCLPLNHMRNEEPSSRTDNRGGDNGGQTRPSRRRYGNTGYRYGGSPGSDGTPGFSGSPGTPGSNGTPGYGVNGGRGGRGGYGGSPGSDGTPGFPGSPGTPGADGSPGYGVNGGRGGYWYGK
eukprot:g7152.t1